MHTPTRSRAARILTGAISLAVAAASASIEAGTVTTTLPTSATIAASCSGFTATALSYGEVGSGANSLTTSTISITCTNAAAYTIALDRGLHSSCSGATNNWSLAGPGAPMLTYQLYKDAARTTLIGPTPGCPGQTTTGLSGTGSGAAQTLTVYGRTGAFSPGALPSGTYSDTVTLTATF